MTLLLIVRRLAAALLALFLTHLAIPSVAARQYVEFDGGRSFVDRSSGIVGFDDPQVITLEAWIRMDEPRELAGIIVGSTAHVTNFGLGLDDSNGTTLMFQWRNPQGGTNKVRSVRPVPPGVWVHVAVVLDGGMATFYLNGEPEAPRVVPQTSPTPSSPERLTIGADLPVSHEWFHGGIDEVRVWNRSQSARQVGIPLPADSCPDGLVSRYSFNSGFGDVCGRNDMEARALSGSELPRRLGGDLPGLSATDGLYEHQVVITWDRLATGAGYTRVDRHDLDGNVAVLAWLPTDVTSYVDAEAEPATFYSYSVGVYNALRTTQLLAALDLGRRVVRSPRNMSASDGSSTEGVTLAWIDASEVESGYVVDRTPGFFDALLLDGVDDYATAPWPPGLDQRESMTIEAVIHKTANARWAPIVEGEKTSEASTMFALGLDSSVGNKLLFQWRNSSQGGTYPNRVASSRVLPDGWVHVAATFDGRRVVFFIDGVAEAPIPLTPQAPAEGNPDRFVIGVDFPGSDEYYQGHLCEIRVWGTVRSAQQISAGVHTPPVPSDPDLMAYWPICSTGSATAETLFDVARGANATLLNGAAVTDSGPERLFRTRSLPANAARLTDRTAHPGDTYRYSVAPFLDGNGNGVFDAGIDYLGEVVSDNGFAAYVLPPTGVVASDGQYDRVRVKWSGQGANSGFRVLRDGSEVATVAPGASTEWEDLTGAGAATYCVVALDASQRESVPRCDPGTTLLAAPTAAAASDSTSDGAVILTWVHANTAHDGFVVERGGTEIGRLAPEVRRFEDREAAPAATTTYCVLAFSNASGTRRDSATSCDSGSRARVLAPTDVAATDGTLEDRVEVTWTNVSTTAGTIAVYQDGVLVATTLPDNGRAVVRGMPSDNEVSYCVRAIAAGGQFYESDEVCDSGYRRLLPPSGVSASDREFEDRVEVTWTNNSTAATHVKIFRHHEGTTAELVTLSPARSSYVDRSGHSRRDYTYAVRAVDDDGSSEEASDPGRRDLLAPTEFKASQGTSESEITLTWTDRSRAEVGYWIWRDDNPSDTLAGVRAQATRFVDTTADLGRTYRYTLQAILHDSSRSDPVEATGFTAVLLPESVNATTRRTDKIRLNWVDRSRHNATYVVTRGGVVLTDALPGTATGYDDETVSNGSLELNGSRSISTEPQLIPAPVIPRSQATIEAWVYLESAQTYGGVLTGRAAQTNETTWTPPFGLSFASDGVRPRFYWGYRVVESTREVPVGEWTHVAATFDGSRVVFYLDGVPEQHRFIAGENFDVKWIDVGGQFTGAWRRMHGRIDELRMWNVVRSHEEIVQTLHQPVADDAPGLIGYWPFDEDKNDRSPSQSHLTYGSAPVNDTNTPVLVAKHYQYCVRPGEVAADQAVCTTGDIQSPQDVAPPIPVTVSPGPGGMLSRIVTQDAQAGDAGWTSDGGVPYARIPVATDGDDILVGMPGEDARGAEAGAAYFFRSDGGSWRPSQKVTHEAYQGNSGSVVSLPWGDAFAWSVDISGDWAIAGATQAYTRYSTASDTIKTGAAYIFRRSGNGSWEQVEGFPSDPSWDDGPWFGESVVIDQDKAAIGIPGYTYKTGGPPHNAGGAVSIYTRRKDDEWAHTEVFRGPEGHQLGMNLDRKGDILVASGFSMVAMMTIEGVDAANWTYTEITGLNNDCRGVREGCPYYPTTVAIGEAGIVIGEPLLNKVTLWTPELFECGSACQNQAISLETRGTRFGQSVATRGDRILVGADGAAFLYEQSGQDWILRSTLTSGKPWDGFGANLALGEEVAIVSAPGDDWGGPNTGAVYVFGDLFRFRASDGRRSGAPGVELNWVARSVTETRVTIYRDDELIASVPAGQESYVDAEAPRGRLVEYCAEGVVDARVASERTCDFGWSPSVGAVSGRVSTQGGAGVPDMRVKARRDEDADASLQLDGENGTWGQVIAPLGLIGPNQSGLTVEAWIRIDKRQSWAPVLAASLAGNAVMAFGMSATGGDKLMFQWRNSSQGGYWPNKVQSTRTIPLDTWTHVAASFDGTDVTFYVNGVSEDALPVPQTDPVSLDYDRLTIGVDPPGTQEHFFGAMDEIRVWHGPRSAAQIEATWDRPLVGTEEGLSAYWPIQPSATGFLGDFSAGGTRHVKLRGNAFRSTDVPGRLVPRTETDADGNYSLTGLAYGSESALFLVGPDAPERTFQPAQRQIRLSEASPVENNVEFIDVSSYTLAGDVTYAQTECVVSGVAVSLDNQVLGSTKDDGRFTLAVSRTERAQVLSPSLNGHRFEPSSQQVTMDADRFGIDFSDLTTRELGLSFVGGMCGFDIGSAELTIRSENGCLSRTVTATATSSSQRLPPQKYFITVDPGTLTEGIDRADVIRFFDRLGPIEVDLTNRDSTLAVRYEASVALEIAGLPGAGDPGSNMCSAPDHLGVPILSQDATYPVTISAGQRYGSRFCRAGSGTLRIADGIGDRTIEGEVDDEGSYQYTLVAGQPNILQGLIVDGVDRSYQKRLEVTLTVPGRDPVVGERWAIVEGSKPRIGTFTSAATDPIPILALHDPPGDGSYSYIEAGTTMCTSMSSTFVRNLGGGVDTDNTWGYEFAFGVPFSQIIFFGTAVGFRARYVAGQQHSSLLPCSDDVARVKPYLAGPAFSPNEGLDNLELFQNSLVTSCAPKIELCLTATERIQTDASPNGVGPDADVFVGAVANFLFAEADELNVDPSCQITLGSGVSGKLTEISSVALYPQSHIKNVLIPKQQELVDSGKDPDGKLTNSIANLGAWMKPMASTDWDNFAPGPRFLTKPNQSFSAGVQYEWSQTRDFTWTPFQQSVGLYFNSETSPGLINQFAGYEQKTYLFFESQSSWGIEEDSTESTSTRIGYVLSDDDLGDSFTFDVGFDPRYGTPIFELKAGQTSNPWEPWLPLECYKYDPDWLRASDGTDVSQARNTWNPTCDPKTQPYDLPSLTAVPTQLSGVAPDQPAVFTLGVNNESMAGAAREYAVRSIATSNPFGARVSINGANNLATLPLVIPPNESATLTLEVDRGPVKYAYDDLKVMAYPPGEYDVWRDGGVNGNGLIQLADTLRLGVQFEAPCSDVNLLRPSQGWIANSGQVEFVIDGFEISREHVGTMVGSSAPERRRFTVGLQYRGQGESAWISPNSLKVTGDQLDVESYSGTWDIPADDAYEVRAYSECRLSDAAPTKAAVSASSSGLADSTPPRVLGESEPADRVLSMGDEVRLAFNEAVRVGSSGVTMTRVSDPTTPIPLRTVLSADRTRLVVEAEGGWNPLEGELVELTLFPTSGETVGVEDLAGNPLDGRRSHVFRVSRSELALSPMVSNVTAFRDEPATVKTTIVNGSSEGIDYAIDLETLPDWLEFYGLPAGTLRSGERREIVFDIPSLPEVTDGVPRLGQVLIIGTRHDGVTTVSQSVAFYVNLLVVEAPCPAPEWSVDPTRFQYGMTITGRANLALAMPYVDLPSGARVAAVVGGEVRGVAEVGDSGRFYLTVLSTSEQGELVTLWVWDPETCSTLKQTTGDFIFRANAQVGLPDAPVMVLAPVPPIENELDLRAGWTFFSPNKIPASNTLNNVLGQLRGSDGDVVKSQSDGFALYDAASDRWVGTLATLDPTKAYLARLGRRQRLKYLNDWSARPDLTLGIRAGWNWIGFVPAIAHGVDGALANAIAGGWAPVDGDLIKSQTAFAQFSGGTWVGSLTELVPGGGYLLRTASAGVFGYQAEASKAPGEPAAARLGLPSELRQIPGPSSHLWKVAGVLERSMTVTARVDLERAVLEPAHVLVGAFSADTLRGLAELWSVDRQEGAFTFLVVHGRQDGEPLELRMLDTATGRNWTVAEFAFRSDAALGTLQRPAVLTPGTEVRDLGDLVLPETFELHANYPNPFNPRTTIRFDLPEDDRVELAVFDVLGRRVVRLLEGPVEAGRHVVVFDGADLASGVYLYRMKTSTEAAVRRMVLLR